MSLKLYRRPRLVALNPGTPVLDAARAIESNNIGAVVIHDKGRIVGIVTDRDLTVRVLGRGLDPKTTLLEDVMTSPVVTLSLADSQDDAIRLMQERNVRRIPLVEGERLVGIVTLDDLLLDEAAPLDQLASIVEAQIGEGGPAASPRTPAMERRAARAEATLRRVLNQLREDAGLETVEEAETALDVVLNSLVRRLTPSEAKDLIAQLPSLLQPKL
ncbi:MAG TPA: CBS domain-containing protein, partial [Blastocatellia bacterium]|nr:CBS domain-containing protein [Blastocatellia bacterium]